MTDVEDIMTDIVVYGSEDKVQLGLGPHTFGLHPDDAKWIAEQLIFYAIKIEKFDGALPYEIEVEVSE